MMEDLDTVSSTSKNIIKVKIYIKKDNYGPPCTYCIFQSLSLLKAPLNSEQSYRHLAENIKFPISSIRWPLILYRQRIKFLYNALIESSYIFYAS